MVTMKQSRWKYPVVCFFVVIALNLGLSYLLQGLGHRFEAILTKLSWLAYLSVFAITLVCNLTILVPVSVATAVMVAAANTWEFLKYVVASYSGIGLIHFLSFWSH